MAKFEWKDGVDGGTPLSAGNLNAMQDGIYEDIYKYQYNLITNDKGNCVKYENGILICWGEKSFTNTNVIEYGGMYRSTSVAFDDFPIAFKDVPNVTYSIKELDPNVNGALLNVLTTASTTNAGRCCVVKENNSQITGKLGYMAIGNWK